MYDTPAVYTWKDPASPPHLPALQCHFIVHPEVNVEATKAMNVQTYDDVTVIYIYPMGMPKSNAAHEIERRLPDGKVIQTRYALKYGAPFKMFKDGISSETMGTPLKDLIGMTPATIMTLRSLGIFTIEMLADMQDAASGNLMGFYELRSKAQKHIEHRKEMAPTLRMDAIEAEHKATVASLERQLEDMRQAMAAQAAGDGVPAVVPKRGPGRPPKVAEPEAEAA